MQFRPNSGKAVTHPRTTARRERALARRENELDRWENATHATLVDQGWSGIPGDITDKIVARKIATATRDITNLNSKLGHHA